MGCAAKVATAIDSAAGVTFTLTWTIPDNGSPSGHNRADAPHPYTTNTRSGKTLHQFDVIRSPGGGFEFHWHYFAPPLVECLSSPGEGFGAIR